MRVPISKRFCAHAGIPSSSMVSPTTLAPYFFTAGRILSITAASPFTEFTIATPFTARRAARITAGSVESICKGRSITDCSSLITSTIISFSSIPGSPTFTSRISAPPSTSSMAIARISSIRCSCRAAFMRLFPVGLMRSPITCTSCICRHLVGVQA